MINRRVLEVLVSHQLPQTGCDVHEILRVVRVDQPKKVPNFVAGDVGNRLSHFRYTRIQLHEGLERVRKHHRFLPFGGVVFVHALCHAEQRAIEDTEIDPAHRRGRACTLGR